METKVCFKCKMELPISRFSKNKYRKDGLQTGCKICMYKYGRDWLARNYEHVRQMSNTGQNSRRQKRRLEILSYYSNGELKCSMCGYDNPASLEINHLDGDGRKHHKKINGDIVRYIRENNNPDEFNVLCGNCNWKEFLLRNYDNTTITYSKEYGFRKKISAFQIYSDYRIKCAVCGEDDIDVLTIDHIDGGGNKHKKKLKQEGIEGRVFYEWLEKNLYPFGYRVLCRNCQRTEYYHNACINNELRRS